MNAPFACFRSVAVTVAIAGSLIGCDKPAAPSAPPTAAAPAEQTLDLPGTPPAPRAPAASAAPAAHAAPASRLPVDPATKLAIERYFNETGRAPQSWADLIAKKYIGAAPLDATGKPVDFNKFLFDMR
ncbi:hypothetical protein LBMAG56_46170 [Verrucomicrobiota bacterium]|nr:hypothetical protein LBMAG56_46170 [Verrucomicrobiota bacterium]